MMDINKTLRCKLLTAEVVAELQHAVVLAVRLVDMSVGMFVDTLC